ncbi:RDD family protein [Pontibacter akesuensis]|uniref:RDD family protein n=1 Tax=Pontibacter akesuensis TaxID=388950 RepID=A0A1I7KLU7_9BACT|nr:RDD family protein [Pontibacter akesuensis]GHA77790.1 hypothetical protein GCM10007389_34500 [Pontibacter akesuensis]SFU98381.1 RDD family protein [Pontibacter akesuensis]
MQAAFTVHAPPTIKRSALYGSLTARLVSFLVDTTLIVFSYTFVLYGISGSQEQLYTWDDLLKGGIDMVELWLVCKSIFINPIFAVLHWAYYTFLESSLKQATIGKFTLGLKVTDLRGRRIGFLQANLRYFAKFLSVLLLGLGFLLILSSRRHQMLHDYIARALVVAD